MTEKLSPEIADAFAAAMAASDQRGWSRGFEAGYQSGFTAGATAQKELMDKSKEAEKPQPQQPSQIILVDEGGIERVLDAMEHPDA